MKLDEIFKDWIFRYQYIYNSRLTDKKKTRFIKSLFTDIMKFRQDVQIIEYNSDKGSSLRNIYVGDIETADEIVCTYYDTAPNFLGDYHLFDRNKQKASTTNFILLSSTLTILLGVVGTYLYIKFIADKFEFLSIQTLGLVGLYGLYFLMLSNVVKGNILNKNLIRNTSSILTILDLIRSTSNTKRAYAFIDDGCYGDRGLEPLLNQKKKRAKIIYLDSIGAQAPLHIEENIQINETQASENITYVFSANPSESDDYTAYFLSKKDLKEKKINIENISKLNDFLKG
ncbi:hypothetical protein [Vagococcus zengguangii]|uniref:Uncharacterized protein n=1 Tax=Vagococcus zengguangii TaxID=2571750 RepID=A0A4D7CSV8_9ENTE|nr:hypothetical protein [Vagococcus zengguangii]QCI85556.1 hypothetical protein FA707_00590 [Vagococcus zengguangii]TLG79409.1 hypothetical protein FE258_08665 [Vagococcus zengguangii]